MTKTTVSDVRLQQLLLVAVLLLGAMLYVSSVAANPVSGSDGSTYMGLAQSILKGNGYVFNGHPHVQYPPGLPFFLAATGRLISTDFQTLQRILAGLSLIGAGFGAILVSRMTGAKAWIVSLFMILNVRVFFLSVDAIRSEPLYGVTTLALLFIADREQQWDGWKSWGHLATVFALSAASAATRSIGIALAAAGFASTLLLLLSRHRALPRIAVGLAVGLGALAANVAWFVWVRAQSALQSADNPMQSYFSQMRLRDPHTPDLGDATPSDLILRVGTMLMDQLGNAAKLLTNLPWIDPSLSSPVVAVLAVLIVVGGISLFRRGWQLSALYGVAYIGVLLLWPFDEGPRFLVPILPLLIACGIVGCHSVATALAIGEASTIRRACLLVAAGEVGVWLAEHTVGGQVVGSQAVLGAVSWLGLGIAGWFLPGSELTAWPRWLRRDAVVISFLLASSLVGVVRIAEALGERQDRQYALQDDQFLSEAVDWFRINAQPNARIMAERTSEIHFRLGALSWHFPVTGNTERLMMSLTNSRADYLLVQDPLPYPYFFPGEVERLRLILARDPTVLQLATRYRGGAIYRVIRTP